MSTSRPEPKRVARERLAEEREKQQAAEKAKERTLRLLVIGVVVLLVVGIAGLVFWQQNKPVDAARHPRRAPTRKTGRDQRGHGTRGGQFCEDFQCPACAAFEERVGDTVNELVAADSITAGLLPADLPRRQPRQRLLAAGRQRRGLRRRRRASSPKFHATVYANQPPEEGEGYTDAQLLQFGKDAGITGDGLLDLRDLRRGRSPTATGPRPSQESQASAQRDLDADGLRQRRGAAARGLHR